MIASAPTYRPRKKFKVQDSPVRNPNITRPWSPGGPTLKPRKKNPYQTPTPNDNAGTVPPGAPPGTAATPPGQNAPVTSTAPPETLQGHQQRYTTNQTFQTGVGDFNTQLQTLGRDFGGVPNVLQFGYKEDPTTHMYSSDVSQMPITPNLPNSQVATQQRNYLEGNRQEGLQANAGNTFFSGEHIVARDQNQGNRDRAIADALANYNNAVAGLTRQYTQALNDRNTGVSGADQTDLDAFMSGTPEATLANDPGAYKAPVPTVVGQTRQKSTTQGGLLRTPSKKQPRKKGSKK